jgi:hypothetical protein
MVRDEYYNKRVIYNWINIQQYNYQTTRKPPAPVITSIKSIFCLNILDSKHSPTVQSVIEDHLIKWVLLPTVSLPRPVVNKLDYPPSIQTLNTGGKQPQILAPSTCHHCHDCLLASGQAVPPHRTDALVSLCHQALWKTDAGRRICLYRQPRVYKQKPFFAVPTCHTIAEMEMSSESQLALLCYVICSCWCNMLMHVKDVKWRKQLARWENRELFDY